MPETLVIRLPDDAAAAAECILVDNAGAPLGPATEDTLEQFAELSAGRRVIGLVPASRVLRTGASIPLRNKARIRQALPFALEEQLAADVEGQHFAFGGRDDAGRIPVAVVAENCVQNWLQQLLDAGIKPDAIFAESDGLSAVPATVIVLVDGGRIIIRDIDGSTTVADPDSLQAIIELMLDSKAAIADAPVAAAADQDAADTAVDPDADNVPINLLIYSGEDDYERFAVLWDMLRLRVASLDVKILPDGALPRLASQIATAGGVNLLQGVFAPKRELPVQWRQWQLPGMLLGGLLVMALLQAGIGLWQLRGEEQALDQAASELFASTFPNAGATGDPWSALRSRLGNTVTAADPTAPGFAEAIEVLAGAFAATPDIKMEALSFRDGKLDLQLIAPSVERLDLLRQGIAAAGKYDADIQSANPDGSIIKGRLRIATAGGEGA